MEFIDKATAVLLADLLHAYGVEDVVVSPGSRCAPLSLTFARDGRFRLCVMIDERSAAFVALGMAIQSGRPMAALCTSGSAVLNYAPALAEAFYRRVPLIAVSADRPADMIDQRDSQTIRQAGALAAVTRASADIPDVSSPRELAFANRLLNDALSAATGPVPGPVHINMQYGMPLTPLCSARPQSFARKFDIVRPEGDCVPASFMRTIAPASKVLVVAAGMEPGEELRAACRRGMEKGAFVLFSEAQANLGCGIRAIADYSSLPAPDIVVTMGGSVVDARLKAWLRTLSATRHISLGYDDNFTDTFGLLDCRVECDEAAFIEALADRLEPQAPFVDAWTAALHPAADEVSAWLGRLTASFPQASFHFSNGTAIRYAQRVAFPPGCRVESNRGVSGIDGCTSTAIGAAMASALPTVLVSGDMSAAYDIGALAIEGIPPTFRMVVLDNGGGDIFRAVATTRSFEECGVLFSVSPRLPLRKLAEVYGFAYYECGPDEAVPEGFVSIGPAILRLTIQPGHARCLF